MIDGHTRLIAHIGYPTTTFTAPLIYNPYFQHAGINAAVVPMGVAADGYETSFRTIFRFTNLHGALITMPHKRTTLALLDEISTAARICGACNAVLKRADGTLAGDMFDGEGFVRGLVRKGRRLGGASALVVGSGGVGSAIAASLAGAGVTRLGLFDVDAGATAALARRLTQHFPKIEIVTAGNDPSDFGIVVNATPLGMGSNDPMPIDPARISPDAIVGDVVLRPDTLLLAAARAKGCAVVNGRDMLFEQIPAYLDFFGFPSTTPDQLRALAQLPA